MPFLVLLLLGHEGKLSSFANLYVQMRFKACYFKMGQLTQLLTGICLEYINGITVRWLQAPFQPHG